VDCCGIHADRIPGGAIIKKDDQMRIFLGTAKVFSLMFALLVLAPGLGAAEQQQEKEPRPEIFFKRLAVAPIFAGHRIPKLDEALDDTLSCTISEICINDPDIGPGAGPMMTRLVYSILHHRFGANVISMEDVQSAYTGIRLVDTRDTPRTLVRRMGKVLSADLVIFGMVWRYRDFSANDGVPKQPASVAFALYLVDAGSGRRIWRGVFNETQEYVFNNMFKFTDRVKMGLKWLTADELARYGVKLTLDKFPSNVIPATGGNVQSGNTQK
jgi:hypothetical protein